MAGLSPIRKRNRAIVEDFCKGMTPAEIDFFRKLHSGTARNVISDWWLSDKLYRTGCAETVHPSLVRK